MKLEEQVCSLEQAKRLKELGIFQLVIHRWHSNDGISFKLLHNGSLDSISPCCMAAFTVAELGCMLPEYIGYWFLEMYKDSSNARAEDWFLARYVERIDDGTGNVTIHCGFNKKTEAESRSALLIYLLENNHITPAEVNRRLQQ